MIRKILVPLDGSDNAAIALQVAADLAEKHNASLELLHVGQRQPGPLEALHQEAEQSFAEAERSGAWTSDHPDWPRRLQVLEHMGRMILDRATHRAKALGAAEVESRLDWGDEGERIVHHAKHLPADMIVMGSRGASALEGLFLGSVSHKVIHLAPCTCVSVRAEHGRRGIGSPGQIVVPFDGSDPAGKALDMACALAAKSGSGVRLVHVLQHGLSAEQLLSTVDLERLDPDTRRALDTARDAGSMSAGAVFAPTPVPGHTLEHLAELILEPAVANAKGQGIEQVETEILDGDPATCILEAAERSDAGLIVMGMRGFGEVASLLVGSVSYKVNHLSPRTCITVR